MPKLAKQVVGSLTEPSPNIHGMLFSFLYGDECPDKVRPIAP